MKKYIYQKEFDNSYLSIKKIKDTLEAGTSVSFERGDFLQLLLVESGILSLSYFNDKILGSSFDNFTRHGGLRENKANKYYTHANANAIKQLNTLNSEYQDALLSKLYFTFRTIVLPIIKKNILHENNNTDQYDEYIISLYGRFSSIVTQENTYYNELYDTIMQMLKKQEKIEQVLSLLCLIAIYQDDIYYLFPAKYRTRWSEDGFFPFQPEIKPLPDADDIQNDPIPIDTIDFFKKALSYESELGKISTIDMAFHGGSLWLFDDNRYSLLIKAVENGIKIRIIINTDSQVKDICSHMRLAGLSYRDKDFNRNAKKWESFMKEYYGLVDIRISQVPLLRRTYIIRGENDKGWSNITYYSYGHDISKDQCLCFRNTNNAYKLYLEEFNYIWDNASKSFSESSVIENNEISTDSTLMLKKGISHIIDVDKFIIENDYISQLSKSLSVHYKKMIDNIEEVNGFISPFVPIDFSDLIAHNAEGIIELDRKSAINHCIDPIIYEVFLAQKIARSSEQMNFKNVLQLIHLTPDCWRIFVNSTMQIVGYWVFVGLKPEAFMIFSSGTVDESKLTIQDVCFIDMPGWYKGYLLLSGTVSKLRTPSVTYAVYNSWLQALETYSNNNIFFSEISSMVASLGGISTLTHIGMENYASYILDGKMFRYHLIEIDKIQYLKNHFPHMIRNYIKELQKKDGFSTD